MNLSSTSIYWCLVGGMALCVALLALTMPPLDQVKED